ncbi:MAG: hypothetical protein NTX26_00260 [Candidatus Parcubacteria bacterium]|nr:hypothetical protein [Candidatus Parcubacteria bacterium]
MQDALQSLENGLNKLCIVYGFLVGKAESMTMAEKIEKLEAMQGCTCLKELYAGSHPKWQIFTRLKVEAVSFKVYYKKNHGTKLGLAIIEMTPKFFNQYRICRNKTFWNTIEENTFIPVYGVVWKESSCPFVCHSGD